MENKLENYLLEVISGQRKGVLASLTKLILFLLEIIYRVLIEIRSFLYKVNLIKRAKVDCRVISVGNITVGGTGKTPVVKTLAEAYKEKGFNVVVVSRGYRSDSSAPLIVSDGREIFTDEKEAGDEPLMLSRMLPGIPVIIGKDRFQAANLAEKEFSPDTIILDDAFQHWKLRRDKDIVLIDAYRPFGYHHLLPAGLLREPLGALHRADIFLITKINGIDNKKLITIEEKLHSYNPAAEIYRASYHADCIRIFNEHGSKDLESNYLNGKKVLAFSGIGNPDSFRRNLEECGSVIPVELKFPDHHQYTMEDIELISKRSEGIGIDLIITTEKDLVKINEEMLIKLKRYSFAVLLVSMIIEEKDSFVTKSLSY